MAGTEDQNQGSGPGELQESGSQPSEIVSTETPSTLPDGSAPAPTPVEEAAPPPRTDWRDRRIGELTQRNREQRAELERLRAQGNGAAEQPRGPDGRWQQPAGYQGPPNQEQIQQQIMEQAQQLANVQDFNRRCDETAVAARQVYPDFDERVGRLVGLVDMNDPQRATAYNEFLNAALDTGEAGKLIHALGGDLDEASRVLSLPPRRMAIELTRMAMRPAQELSQTPRPINPASTSAQAQRTSTSPDDPGSDNMSTAEWMRRRNEQIETRGRR